MRVREFRVSQCASDERGMPWQEALNAVAMGGGVVWVPAGEFYFTGVLSMPAYVTLEGIFRAAPSHSCMCAQPAHCCLCVNRGLPPQSKAVLTT